MSNKEKIFPEGIRYFEPKKKQPEFVKGSVSINVNKLFEWLDQNGNLINNKGYLNLDFLKSKKGNLYFAVNTYVASKTDKSIPDPTEPQNEIDEEDVPF